MARSSPRGRRAVATPAVDTAASGPATLGAPPSPSLASVTLPRVWQGVGYRPLSDPTPARRLLDFAAVAAGTPAPPALCWGASIEDRLVGAVLGERAETAMLLHGPVVVTDHEPVEVAAQLVAAALDHARALGVETMFARPLGLDRVWIRFGFLPVPEGALPPEWSRAPGSGLYAWRGGTALWTFRERRHD